MSENLRIYEKVRTVPHEAQKPIEGGRLKGKTDINPMWRIKTLTDQFGPCGIGWHYAITKQWLEQGSDGEVAAFVNIELFVKVDGEWSKPIAGTGGSMLVAKERGGLNTSDECYKMALTDAISVACKALGFGADVYWQKDNTKYTNQQEQAQPKAPTTQPKTYSPPQTNGASNGASASQIAYLEKLGATVEQLANISKADASTLITQLSRRNADA